MAQQEPSWLSDTPAPAPTPVAQPPSPQIPIQPTPAVAANNVEVASTDPNIMSGEFSSN